MKFTKKKWKIFKKCNHSFEENLLKKSKFKKKHILFYLKIFK